MLWGRALQLFDESPLWGIGVGQYQIVEKRGAHSMYLQCLSEQGFIGLVLFVVPLIYCLFKTAKLARLVKDSYIAACLCFSLGIQLRYIIYGITENDNSSLGGFLFYAVSIALAIDCNARVKSSKTSLLKRATLS